MITKVYLKTQNVYTAYIHFFITGYLQRRQPS